MLPSPNDPLRGEAVVTNWVTLDSVEGDRTHSTTPANRDRLTSNMATPDRPRLVEAQGWMFGSQGEVILTASASTVTPQTPSLQPVTCPSP